MDNQNSIKWVAIGSSILAIGIILSMSGVFSLNTKTAVTKNINSLQNNLMINNKSNLLVEDLVVGKGDEAVSGKLITVNYVGTLTNGTKFDSSIDRGVPFQFTLGVGQVIKGWDLGVAGMKVGGKRKLTIPSDLGYGSRDMGSIPANSTLIFEVELLGVK